MRVGPNTVARLLRDILFSSSFTATLIHKKRKKVWEGYRESES